jgi:hypothetical protein
MPHFLPRWCGPNAHWNYGCYYTLPTAAIIGIVFAGISIFLLAMYICVVWARRRRYYHNRGVVRDEEMGEGGAGIRGGETRERSRRSAREKRSRRPGKGRSKRSRRWPYPY